MLPSVSQKQPEPFAAWHSSRVPLRNVAHMLLGQHPDQQCLVHLPLVTSSCLAGLICRHAQGQEGQAAAACPAAACHRGSRRGRCSADPPAPHGRRASCRQRPHTGPSSRWAWRVQRAGLLPLLQVPVSQMHVLQQACHGYMTQECCQIAPTGAGVLRTAHVCSACPPMCLMRTSDKAVLPGRVHWDRRHPHSTASAATAPTSHAAATSSAPGQQHSSIPAAASPPAPSGSQSAASGPAHAASQPQPAQDPGSGSDGSGSEADQAAEGGSHHGSIAFSMAASTAAATMGSELGAAEDPEASEQSISDTEQAAESGSQHGSMAPSVTASTAAATMGSELGAHEDSAASVAEGSDHASDASSVAGPAQVTPSAAFSCSLVLNDMAAAANCWYCPAQQGVSPDRAAAVQSDSAEVADILAQEGVALVPADDLARLQELDSLTGALVSTAALLTQLPAVLHGSVAMPFCCVCTQKVS